MPARVDFLFVGGGGGELNGERQGA
jgi:hypothetical protein